MTTQHTLYHLISAFFTVHAPDVKDTTHTSPIYAHVLAHIYTITSLFRCCFSSHFLLYIRLTKSPSCLRAMKGHSTSLIHLYRAIEQLGRALM